jgi:hypothetical protein
MPRASNCALTTLATWLVERARAASIVRCAASRNEVVGVNENCPSRVIRFTEISFLAATHEPDEGGRAPSISRARSAMVRLARSSARERWTGRRGQLRSVLGADLVTEVTELGVGLACGAAAPFAWRRATWLGVLLGVAGLAAVVHALLSMAT